jgi:hypothetical protein
MPPSPSYPCKSSVTTLCMCDSSVLGLFHILHWVLQAHRTFAASWMNQKHLTVSDTCKSSNIWDSIKAMTFKEAVHDGIS